MLKNLQKNFFVAKTTSRFLALKSMDQKLDQFFCAKMTPKGPPEMGQSVLTKNQGVNFGKNGLIGDH